MGSRDNGRGISPILAHWDQTVHGADVTPLQFYNLVLRIMAGHDLTVARISCVTRRESGAFSARRIYLLVAWRKLIFEIGAAPFGNTLTVSWWLRQSPPELFDLLCEIPILSVIIRRFVRPMTFYRVDAISAFQRAVHESVLEAVYQIKSTQAVRGIPAQTDKPILKKFYKT